MADLLSTLSLVAFILAGLFLVTAVLLFFLFKIPLVVGNLTGRTAKKSIAAMRTNNENSGVKLYRPSAVNASRGKLTDLVKETETDGGQPPRKGGQTARQKRHTTGKIAKQQPAARKGKQQTDDLLTEILSEPDQETTFLDPSQMASSADSGATELLDANATTVLTETIQRANAGRERVELIPISEVLLIHTDEVIQ